MSNDAPVTIVDARGHRCPVPSLRLRKALEACEDGVQVDLLADDPMAKIDVPHLVSSLGYTIVSTDQSGGQLRFRIQKSPVPAQIDEAPSS